MTIDNFGDSVGKKIVEALKEDNVAGDNIISHDALGKVEDDFITEPDFTLNETTVSDVDVNKIFQQNLQQNAGSYSRISEYEYPANVAILNNLIAKLPVGVSKQTGALIIRQTMEALGIPMSSVIQEAKQVQENLTRKAAECQQNIIDFKKQINTLELQSMQFQRQAVVMNDIISLFNN